MNMKGRRDHQRLHHEGADDGGCRIPERRSATRPSALSTESCDLLREHCAYLEGKPCRFPEKMHPCLESHGVVVNELVERHSMEYSLGGNTILWFSMVLFR